MSESFIAPTWVGILTCGTFGWLVQQSFGAYSVHGLTTASPEDDVGIVLVLERRLLAAAAVVAGLLLEEAAPA